MKYKRGAEKSVYITPKVAQYVSSLLVSNESSNEAKHIAEHDTGDRSYLHIPYTQGRFLETFTKALGAKYILEIGTFKGYSTAFLARGLAGNIISNTQKDNKNQVVTIDEDCRYIEEARNFWKKMKVEKYINFKLGLAEKTLKEMLKDNKNLEKFDLIFIDADKENYRKYIEYSLKLLKEGGTILVDNTLWRGLVAENIPTDNGAKHIKAFNSWVSLKFKKQSSIITAWDGLTMIVKK